MYNLHMASLLLLFAKGNLASFLKLTKVMNLAPAKLIKTLKLGDKANSVLAQGIGKLTPQKLKQFDTIIQSSLTNSGLVSKTLGKLTTKERKLFSDIQSKFLSNEKETVALSSSWIAKGTFTPTQLGLVGDLAIKVKTGKRKTYTFPGVSRSVWEAMKTAKGQNGSGAGTVFWAQYYRSYSNSSIGRYIKTLQKLAGAK